MSYDMQYARPKPPARHGSRNRYLHGPDIDGNRGKGCRCDRCTAANARAQNVRRIAIDTGTHRPMVDARPVREHVLALKAAGLSYQRVAQLAGVNRETVNLLLYGKPGSGSPPTRKMAAAKADALLAVRADQLPDEGWIPAAGTQRRLRALAVVGWSTAQLADRVGIWKRSLQKIINADGGRRVDTATARRVREVYDELWDVDPLTAGCSPAAVRIVRAHAARNGWLPPIAWDEDLLDLPERDLAAELAVRVAQMDEEELAACWSARYRHGERSVLIEAAGREYGRRLWAQRRRTTPTETRNEPQDSSRTGGGEAA